VAKKQKKKKKICGNLTKIRGIYECRCDERLQTKSKEFTRLGYTGLVLELEHLKTETRSISERFAK